MWLRILQLGTVAVHHRLGSASRLVLSAAACGYRHSKEIGHLLRQCIGHRARHRIDEHRPNVVDQSARYQSLAVETRRLKVCTKPIHAPLTPQPAPRQSLNPKTATICMNSCPTMPSEQGLTYRGGPITGESRRYISMNISLTRGAGVAEPVRFLLCKMR